jgi:hypothetical protein
VVLLRHWYVHDVLPRHYAPGGAGASAALARLRAGGEAQSGPAR